MTFGDLAIGDTFEWRDTAEIQQGPPGPEPMTKATAAHYEFLIHGGRAPDGQWPEGTPKKARGTAEPHYPVRRCVGRGGVHARIWRRSNGHA